MFQISMRQKRRQDLSRAKVTGHILSVKNGMKREKDRTIQRAYQ